MDHHHAAASIAASIGVITSMAGACVAIALGLWSAKNPRSRGFDFAASARRIRTRPIPARDRA